MDLTNVGPPVAVQRRCWQCSGSRVFRGQPCPVCHGTGVIQCEARKQKGSDA